MRYTLKQAEKHKFGNYTLTVEHIPNLLERLVGFKLKEVQYRGEGTVWYELPKNTRCSTYMEQSLSDLYMQMKEFNACQPQQNSL